MSDLKGKTAVVTGSGRAKGLGFAIAKRLAQGGANIVLSDLGTPKEHMPEGKIGTTAEMEALAKEIRAIGVEVIFHPCDVRSESEVEALFAAAKDAFGSVDICVNNAGVGYMMKPMTEVTADEWKLVLEVNLMGAFLCSKYAARDMIARKSGGRIVNIASQAAKSGFPHLPAYVASKHGLVGLTRSNAVELGGLGITVNAVCPNHVTTGLGAEQNEYFARYKGVTVEQYLKDMKGRIPLGRPGLPEDTANAVAFLCSDEAQYITGEALNVSGGEEMH